MQSFINSHDELLGSIGFLKSSAGSSSNSLAEEMRNVQNEAKQPLLTNLLHRTLRPKPLIHLLFQPTCFGIYLFIHPCSLKPDGCWTHLHKELSVTLLRLKSNSLVSIRITCTTRQRETFSNKCCSECYAHATLNSEFPLKNPEVRKPGQRRLIKSTSLSDPWNIPRQHPEPSADVKGTANDHVTHLAFFFFFFPQTSQMFIAVSDIYFQLIACPLVQSIFLSLCPSNFSMNGLWSHWSGKKRTLASYSSVSTVSQQKLLM